MIKHGNWIILLIEDASEIYSIYVLDLGKNMFSLKWKSYGFLNKVLNIFRFAFVCEAEAFTLYNDAE